MGGTDVEAGVSSSADALAALAPWVARSEKVKADMVTLREKLAKLKECVPGGTPRGPGGALDGGCLDGPQQMVQADMVTPRDKLAAQRRRASAGTKARRFSSPSSPATTRSSTQMR